MAKALPQVCDIFPLFLNDLLMLELKKLFLLFEIVNNLLERLLKNSDLFLKHFNLFGLGETSCLVLISCLLLDIDVSALALLVRIELCLFSLEVFELISLPHCFLGQLLVFIMDSLLNFLNVSLGIMLGLFLELLKRLLELSFHLLLHPGLLDFDHVLLLLDTLFLTCTIILPGHELQFIL